MIKVFCPVHVVPQALKALWKLVNLTVLNQLLMP